MQDRQPTLLRNRVAAVAALLAALLACARSQPEPELPRGPLVAGESGALLAILDSFSSLDATPLHRESERLRSAVSPCAWFVATASEGAHALDRVECLAGPGLAPALEALRADAPLLFVLPLSASGDGPQLVGRVQVSPEAVRADVHLRGRLSEGLARWFLPANEPAGAPRLSQRDALIHARLRVRDGLDLASLVAPGSQADAMFRLKSALFSGAALGDAWEFVIHLPLPGHAMPRMTLSLDLRDAALAKRGIEGFVRELEATWPLRARAVEWGAGASGACFDELRLMPELAPCYAVSESLLAFGWNAASLEAALEPNDAPRPDAPSRLVARLLEFPEADARLRAAIHGRGVVPAAAPVPLPYSRLRIDAFADGDSVRFEVTLERETHS